MAVVEELPGSSAGSVRQSPSTLLLRRSKATRNISTFLGPFFRVYRAQLPGLCSQGGFVALFVLFSLFYPRSVCPQVTSQFLDPGYRKSNSLAHVIVFEKIRKNPQKSQNSELLGKSLAVVSGAKGKCRSVSTTKNDPRTRSEGLPKKIVGARKFLVPLSKCM